MQPTWKTTDRIWPEGARPVGLAKSGDVNVFVWECDDEYQMHIYREDPQSGEVDAAFRSCDIQDLTRLMAIVAKALHQIGTSDDSLDERLALLADRLRRALEVSTDADGRPDHEAMQ